jgi:hypothetical protein
MSYIIYIDEVALSNENRKLNTTPQRCNHKEKRPIPPKKTTRELIPKFAARGQLFRAYFPTPTSNNNMKQNPSSNSMQSVPGSTRRKKSYMKTTSQKQYKRQTNFEKTQLGHSVLHAVHDHRALLTLEFCKAISSTYNENST